MMQRASFTTFLGVVASLNAATPKPTEATSNDYTPPSAPSTTTTAPVKTPAPTELVKTSAPTPLSSSESNPYTSAPATKAPTVAPPKTSAPTPPSSSESNPYTSAPATKAPTVAPPKTSAPATPIPVTLAPPTLGPATTAPTAPPPKSTTPATQAPVTPTPDTPAPKTSAPVTPAPVTSVPATPAPVTSSPATPAPATPAPATSSPATPAPATPELVTPSPGTAAPATSAPVTPSPATQFLATQTPATQAPASPGLVTSVPVPTTIAPAPSPGVTTSSSNFESNPSIISTAPLSTTSQEASLFLTQDPLANTTDTNGTSVNTNDSSSGLLDKTQAPLDSSPSSAGLIAGVVCGALVLALVVMTIVWRRKWKTITFEVYHSQSSPHEEAAKSPIFCGIDAQIAEKAPTATMSSDRTSPKEPPATDFVNLDCLRMLRLEPKDLIAIGDRPISSGAFGEVWLGEFVRERVAIKRIKDKSINNIRRFRNEINLMAKIQSCYIITLVGASWLRPTDLECVVEYMDRGDLRTILETTNQVEFPWEEKLSSIIAIVRGCIYLHTFEPQIIHRDLKSRNVLLDSKKGTKITDFGEAREMDDRTLTNGIGTYQWMAPEVLIGNNYTAAADVYSFGVILSEFSTHSVPYSDMINPKNNKPYSHQYIMTQVGYSLLKPSFDVANTPVWVLQLAEQCLAHDPDQRPTMIQINLMLSRL